MGTYYWGFQKVGKDFNVTLYKKYKSTISRFLELQEHRKIQDESLIDTNSISLTRHLISAFANVSLSEYTL